MVRRAQAALARSGKLPSRKLMVGGALALGVATLIAVGAKRDHGDSPAA